jgi:hypothetical protein
MALGRIPGMSETMSRKGQQPIYIEVVVIYYQIILIEFRRRCHKPASNVEGKD